MPQKILMSCVLQGISLLPIVSLSVQVFCQAGQATERQVQTAVVHRSEILWAAARTRCEQGDALPDKQAKSYYLQAYGKAAEAVAADSTSAGAHFWLGLSSAKLARLAGPFTGLRYVRTTEREMKEVIRLDPTFSDAGAHRVLGRLYHKLPRILGGSQRLSERHLEAAVRIAPRHVLNHLYLAETLEVLGKYGEADQEAQRVLDLPPERRSSSLDEDPRAEAERLRRSLAPRLASAYLKPGKKGEPSVTRGEGGVVFEGSVSRGQSFRYPLRDRLVFELIPIEFGWEIVLRSSERPQENLARLTPPSHGINPRYIEGWHFRNADNTGPNDGSVNAPQEKRQFHFSPKVGKTIDYPLAAQQMRQIADDGRGTLTVTDLRLGNLGKGQRAHIEAMKFRVELRHDPKTFRVQ